MKKTGEDQADRKIRVTLPHPMRAAAEKIVDRFKPHESAGAGQALNEQLLLMAFGRRDAVRSYYVDKISRILTVTLLLAVLTSVLLFRTLAQSLDVADGRLPRPDYQGGSRQEELIATAEGESEKEELTVTISQRRYTDTEVSTLLDRAIETWEMQMPGENVSVDEVRTELSLPSAMVDGAVSVSYLMIPYGIVYEDGTIAQEIDEEGEVVEIQAAFSCQETTRTRSVSVRVLPPVLSDQDAFWRQVTDALERADETEAELPYLSLPAAVSGRRLTWQYPESPVLKLSLVMLLLAPAALWLLFDSRVNEKAKLRTAQLQIDYGELMWKMTMLTGAGLTIRSTFFKIAEEYENRHGQQRYVYEEVVRTCREMKSGIGEEKAYEAFGRRCGLPSYRRLGSILAQNLKKGAKGLNAALEKEAVTSMEERRSAARELGEKAGTRLLFPMIMMLGVVVVVLIVPAFITF